MFYQINGFDINDTFIELVDVSNPYSVTVEDIFSLQFYEGCCQDTVEDNIEQHVLMFILNIIIFLQKHQH